MQKLINFFNDDEVVDVVTTKGGVVVLSMPIEDIKLEGTFQNESQEEMLSSVKLNIQNIIHEYELADYPSINVSIYEDKILIHISEANHK